MFLDMRLFNTITNVSGLIRIIYQPSIYTQLNPCLLENRILEWQKCLKIELKTCRL